MNRALLTLLLIPISTWAQEPSTSEQWAWFRSSSSGSADGLVWFITQGKGTIHRSGGKLNGQLFDGKDTTFVRHDFTGNIKGRDITLIVVNNGTDASSETFEGQLHRQCYDTHSGQKYMVLKNGGPIIIGLLREIHAAPHCVSKP
jgi:hypothetical protein